MILIMPFFGLLIHDFPLVEKWNTNRMIMGSRGCGEVGELVWQGILMEKESWNPPVANLVQVLLMDHTQYAPDIGF